VKDLSERTSKFMDRGSFLSKAEDESQDILMQASRGGEGIVPIHSKPRRKNRVVCQHDVPAAFAL